MTTTRAGTEVRRISPRPSRPLSSPPRGARGERRAPEPVHPFVPVHTPLLSFIDVSLLAVVAFTSLLVLAAFYPETLWHFNPLSPAPPLVAPVAKSAWSWIWRPMLFN